MGGKGSGRKPSVETIIKRQQPEQTPIGDGIFIPNLSGDLSRAKVRTTPTQDLEPVNKKYVDDAVAGVSVKLNEVENPDASKTFNLGNNKFLSFTSVDRTPIADEGIFNWETSGNFTGDLCHIHQHTGNAGVGTILLHLEAEDTDITPFRISDGVPNTIFNVDLSGNLTLAGTVDGIDIATDVAANTLKVTNVTTNLSAGTRAPTTIDVNSSDGTNATLVEADTTNAGILGSDKWDEIVAATAHVADNTQAHTDYLLNSGVDVGVGLTLTGDNSSADTQYTAQVLYGTDATPPAASGFPVGTIYIQYTA